MRPPIPGAHPAVTAQDGHREEGEITHHTRGGGGGGGDGGDGGGGFFLFCSQSQSQSQIPWVVSPPRPQLNKIISFWDGPGR